MAKAKILQYSFLVAPIFFHFDPQFQERLGAQQRLDIMSCFLPDFFQQRTLLADDDSFLRITLDKDNR
jgi:hypothetical protein